MCICLNSISIGGTPPYPSPPDDRSELDYLNELITDTHWFCYAFRTHEQIDKLNEHESTMDPEVVVKVARDMYLVYMPRYLAQFLKKRKAGIDRRRNGLGRRRGSANFSVNPSHWVMQSFLSNVFCNTMPARIALSQYFAANSLATLDILEY